MKRQNPTRDGACAVKPVLLTGILLHKHPTPQAFSTIQPFSRTGRDRLRMAVRQRRLTDAIALIEAAGYSKDSVVFVLQSVGV